MKRPSVCTVLVGLAVLLVGLPLAATALEAPPWATPGSWIQTDQITPSEATEPGWNGEPHHHFASFGASMDTHGGRLIVGAYGIEGAYIFEWTGDEWDQIGTIEPGKSILSSRGSADDVAIYEDMAVVGAAEASYLGMTKHGVAYIYEETEEGNWVETAAIAEGGEAHAMAGRSVAAGEDIAVIGTPQEGPGLVSIYERSNGSWQLAAQFEGPEPNSLGRTVEIEGETVFASTSRGDPRDKGGQVYVYERSEDGWLHTETLMPPHSLTSFGYSIGVDQDAVIVGAPYSEHWGGEEVHPTAAIGEAFVYERFEDGWELTGHMESPVPLPRDPFLGLTKGERCGSGVAIQGDTAVVGCEFAEPQRAGAAYVYESVEDPVLQLDKGAWERSERLVYNETYPGDLAGVSAEIEGDTILVGVPHDTNRRDVPVHPVSEKGYVPLVLGHSGQFAGAVFEFQRTSEAIR